jgi:hypothetical protein
MDARFEETWPPELREIQNVLKAKNSDLPEKIVRNLGDFTVAMLAISANARGPVLAGTGTLLESNGAHFILTARHVWAERLAGADQVAITLKPGVPHRFAINRKDFDVFGLPRPDEWNQWGPDLALLRISKEHVGSILTHKVFLSLQRPARQLGRVLEVQVLMGTPFDLSRTIDAHAELQITGWFLGPERKQERGGLDYLDYELDLTFPGMPRRFGGVSGGGVWNVYIYRSPETGEIDWGIALHGVAFYELDIVNEHRPIRCHGPQSLNAAMRTIG